MTPFSGAVLAGGASTRMGADKALVAVAGTRLVLVAAGALREAGAGRVVAVGGDAGRLQGLGLTTVADRWPGEGPLGAITTALAALDDEVVAVLSCDLPHVTREAVAAVVDALGDGDAAVPEVGGRRQVLLAAYRRSRCLPAFEAAFAAGERAPRRALGGLDVVRVALADERWALNVNRPEDLP